MNFVESICVLQSTTSTSHQLRRLTHLRDRLVNTIVLAADNIPSKAFLGLTLSMVEDDYNDISAVIQENAAMILAALTRYLLHSLPSYSGPLSDSECS